MGALRNLLMMAIGGGLASSLTARVLEGRVDKADLATCRNCLILSGVEKGEPTCPIKVRRMPNVCAAVIRVQLRKLELFNNLRISHARLMSSIISGLDACELPEVPRGSKCVFTRFVVKVPEGMRNMIRRELLRRGIDTSRPYWYLSGFLKHFGRFPIATSLSKTLIGLPNSPNLTEELTAWIAEEFTSVLRSLLKR